MIPAGSINDRTMLAATDLHPSLCKLASANLNRTVCLDGPDMSEAPSGKTLLRNTPIRWDYRRNEVILKPGNPNFINPNLAMR